MSDNVPGQQSRLLRVEEAIKRLKNPKPDERRRGAFLISYLHADTGAQAAIPALRSALRDQDRRVRISAAEALGLLGGDVTEPVSVLIESVAAEDPACSMAAIDAIGYIGPAAALAAHALTKALRDPDRRIRLSAAHALRTIEPPPEVVGAALIEALHDSEFDIATAVRRVVTGIGRPMVPFLIRALDSPSSGIRYSAVKALQEIRWVPANLAPALLQSLKDDNWSHLGGLVVGLFAPDAQIEALTWIECPGTVFSDALETADLLTRELIARTLWRSHRLAAVCAPALLKALRDEHPRVREFALHALISVSTANPELRTTVAPAVLACLDDDVDDIRTEAIHGVGLLGASEAEPRLRALLGDPQFREPAVVALWRLTGEVKPMLDDLRKAIEHCDIDLEFRLIRRVGRDALAVVSESRLSQRLHHADPDQRKRWSAMLAHIAPEITARELLRDEDEFVRLITAESLGKAGTAAESVIPLLLEAVHQDPSERVRVTAAKAIWQISRRADDIIELVLQWMPSRLYSCKDRVLLNGEQSLDDLRTLWPDYLEFLADVLRSNTAALSQLKSQLTVNCSTEAINSCRVLFLVTQEADAIVQPLTELLARTEWPMPIAAMDLAALIGPKAAPLVPALIQHLRSDYWLYRCYAAQALGRIGPVAADAVLSLLFSIDDLDHEKVRAAACEALGRIRPDVAPAVPVLLKVINNDYARRRLSGVLTVRPERLAAVLGALLRRHGATAETTQYE